MDTSPDSLGGRLALLRPADLDADQKALHGSMMEKLIPWARESGFRADLGDGRLVGPFNPLLVSPKIGRAFTELLGAERQNTSLSARVREVVILSVGAVWQSAYELYAHTAVAAKAGLDRGTVDALAAGRPADGLTADEAVAGQFATRLAADHQVDPDLYDRAVARLGEKGVVDLIHLAGLYMATSALLNAFAVPVPQD